MTQAIDELLGAVTSVVNASVEQTTVSQALAQEVAGKMGGIDAKVEAKEREVDAYLGSARAEQTHIRMTKNQHLLPSEDGTFPLHWSRGYTVRATLIETVVSGVLPETRSDVAREFLRALDTDIQHFAGRFNIWELELAPNRRSTGSPQLFGYGMHQYSRGTQYCTAGAVVKHISGVVPINTWCSGLEANQPAKLCVAHYKWGKQNGRNRYNICHPFVFGADLPDTDTTIIQVALPAVVTGHIDAASGWGQFPYLGDADTPAFD